MPLSNLKIRNWRQANVSPAADNNNLVVNGDTVYNTHALAKSARLTISNINTDQYNSEFENDGSLNVGYWTVCARDLSISGHSGKEKSHWVNQFNNSSPNCPLYHTEWDPGNTPMLGIYAQQAIEENGGFLPTWLQPPTPCSSGDLEDGLCDRNDWYIRFKPSASPKTSLYLPSESKASVIVLPVISASSLPTAEDSFFFLNFINL